MEKKIEVSSGEGGYNTEFEGGVGAIERKA